MTFHERHTAMHTLPPTPGNPPGEPGTDTTLYFDRLIALEKARRGIPPQPRAA